MIRMHLLIVGLVLLYNVQMVYSVVCYQCTECPEPFIETYPYVTLSNNTNFLAQCIKTVMTLGNGRRLVTRGSVFFCPPETISSDVQIYCCGSDFCNSSIRLNSLSFLYKFCLFVTIAMYLFI